jgi:hypothetical protein
MNNKPLQTVLLTWERAGEQKIEVVSSIGFVTKVDESQLQIQSSLPGVPLTIPRRSILRTTELVAKAEPAKPERKQNDKRAKRPAKPA